MPKPHGLNFSASGTRWRVVIVTPDMATREYVPRLPGPGLLFTADDGSSRFMPFDATTVPTLDELQRKTNDELGSLAVGAAVL